MLPVLDLVTTSALLDNGSTARKRRGDGVQDVHDD